MSKADYEVGYGKPPKHTRFQKGKSGNPSGKRKRPPTVAEVLDRHLSRKIVVTPTSGKDKGKKVALTALEALMLRLINEGLGGKLQATREVLSMAKEYGLFQPPQIEEQVVFRLNLDDGHQKPSADWRDELASGDDGN
jgi:hypothetical protein